MERIREGIPLTIGTYSYLEEGVDVPAWEILFLTSLMATGSRVLQVKGSIVRARLLKKRALIVDFVDRDMPFLMAMDRPVVLYHQINKQVPEKSDPLRHQILYESVSTSLTRSDIGTAKCVASFLLFKGLQQILRRTK